MAKKGKIISSKKKVPVRGSKKLDISIKGQAAQEPAVVHAQEPAPVAIPTPPEYTYDIIRVCKNSWYYFKSGFWKNLFFSIISIALMAPLYIMVFKVQSAEFKLYSYLKIFGLEILYMVYFLFFMSYLFNYYHRYGSEKHAGTPGKGPFFRSVFIGGLRIAAISLLMMLILFVLMAPFVIIMLMTKGSNVALVISAVLMYVVILGGMIYFGIVYGPSFVIAAIEPKIIKALAESEKITRGKRGKIFLTWLLYYAIMMAVEMVIVVPVMIGAVLYAAVKSPIVNVIIVLLSVVVGVLFACFVLYIYAFYYSLYRECKDSAQV